MPLLAQVPQRGPIIIKHDCYTDSIYYVAQKGYYGYDTMYIETPNPHGLEYEFVVDYLFSNMPWGWQLCVNEDGDTWCSDVHYYKWQQLGLYGYSEYHDRKLIYTGLDRSQMPPDYTMYKLNWYASDEREEDHYGRIKFTSRAKSIKYGFICPPFAQGWMHPKCFVWDRATGPTTTDKVRYYDLMGREVVPQTTGIYIKVQGNESEKVFISEFENIK